MNNTTQPTDDTPCTDYAWCGLNQDHETEHFGQADLAQITATGDRTAFTEPAGGGVLVPEVIVALTAPAIPSSVKATCITIEVSTDDGCTRVAALSSGEAQLLIRHLSQLLREDWR